MNDNYVVEFVTTKREVTKRHLPDTYQLRKDRGWIWLQKFALWVLRKLGCFVIHEDVTYTRHRIDTRNLLDAIMKQHSEIMTLYHMKGERLLVGNKQFHDLTGIAMQSPYSFGLTYNWGMAGHPPTVCGLEVTVVPWMDGILVVPGDTPNMQMTPVTRRGDSNG